MLKPVRSLSRTIIAVFNPATQIGFFVFGFGSIFFWVIATRADYSLLTWRRPLDKTSGIVTSVREHNPAAKSRNMIRISHYTYNVGGRMFDGIAYTTGRKITPGERVVVDYWRRGPQWSRVEGMRHDLYVPAAGLVTIFPILGVLLIIASIRGGLKTISDGEANPLVALLALVFPAFVVWMNVLALLRHI